MYVYMHLFRFEIFPLHTSPPQVHSIEYIIFRHFNVFVGHSTIALQIYVYTYVCM